ncbi:MAG: lipocalin family protein [Alistipes sp.]
MKLRYKFFLMAALVTLLTGCGKNDEPSPIAPIAGQWQLTAWAANSEFPKGVYLEIQPDYTFNLYQDLAGQGYQKLTGTFTYDLTTQLITGVYTDGTAWLGSYTISEITATTMKWKLGSTTEVSTYTRTVISETITNQTRATTTPDTRFL